MLTYTLPAYIVYTTTFCLITQEVICPPLTHAAKYIQNNIYFFNQVSTFAVGLFCWLFTHLSVSICRILYFIASTGCGNADEHMEHSAVAEWDAAFRSAHRAFEALPVSMIRCAGLIQKLRSFSCSAIFQFVKNNSRQRMNFPSENSTIISALARSAQTYF